MVCKNTVMDDVDNFCTADLIYFCEGYFLVINRLFFHFLKVKVSLIFSTVVNIKFSANYFWA